MTVILQLKTVRILTDPTAVVAKLDMSEMIQVVTVMRSNVRFVAKMPFVLKI